jgi:hypothetical protein
MPDFCQLKAPNLNPSPTKNNNYKVYEFFFFFLAVLGFELRAFTLSHSTSPTFVKDFSR